METNSFKLVTTISIVGLISTMLLSTAKAGFDSTTWWNTEQEKTQAQSDKAIADAYQKNQIATFDSLIISNYTLGKTPPQLDWRRTVDPSKKTLIYDRYRSCVGYALNNKFYFILYYKGACQ